MKGKIPRIAKVCLIALLAVALVLVALFLVAALGVNTTLSILTALVIFMMIVLVLFARIRWIISTVARGPPALFSAGNAGGIDDCNSDHRNGRTDNKVRNALFPTICSSTTAATYVL